MSVYSTADLLRLRPAETGGGDWAEQSAGGDDWAEQLAAYMRQPAAESRVLAGGGDVLTGDPAPLPALEGGLPDSTEGTHDITIAGVDFGSASPSEDASPGPDEDASSDEDSSGSDSYRGSRERAAPTAEVPPPSAEESSPGPGEMSGGWAELLTAGEQGAWAELTEPSHDL